MRAVVALSILAAGCGAGDVGGGGGDDTIDEPRSAAHQRCVDGTNEYRTGNGRPTVAWSAAVEAYAQDGAEYDFEHTSPYHAHFMLDGGGGIAWAENECPHWGLGFGGGDLEGLVDACLQAFFDEGPGGGHYENMMGDYGTVGCGIYESGGEVTIVQDFGD